MLKLIFGPSLYVKADRLGTYASALAYCFVLSMVPFLAVTFVLGTHLAVELSLTRDYYAKHYANVLGEIIPGQDPKDTARIFMAIQNSYQSKNGGFVLFGFIIALYTSYNLMDQIIRTLLFIFDDPRKPQEWTWKMYGKTFLLLLIWMGLLLLISISAVETTFIGHLLDNFVVSSLSKALTTLAQVLVVVTALFGTFYLTYLLVPEKSYKRALVVEGSLLSSTGWIVCSLVFAYIIPKLLQTSASFIALGSIVAILLWAQACSWAIIIGACWIVRFSPPRTRKSEKSGAKG